MMTMLAGEGLTVPGWITMLLSVGFVSGLLGWSVWKVITTPGETDRLHSQLDMGTPDVEGRESGGDGR